MLKRGPQNKEKKLLSAAGLLREVRKVFEKIPSIRTNARGRERDNFNPITMARMLVASNVTWNMPFLKAVTIFPRRG